MSKILLVGCGKMGGSLLAGWLARGVAKQDVVVVDPSVVGKLDVTAVADLAQIPAPFTPDVVVLAVKPQMMDKVLPGYERFSGAVFLSIAAGKTIAYFTRALGEGVAIVRAMPNTPAAVGRGMTVAVPNKVVTAEQRRQCEALLAAVGDVALVEDEALIDAVTAVSGSGPAYVFLLAETLAQAGVAAGLPEDLAARLARATVSGSGELLNQSSESPATLRQNVTSPNGTTFAALQVLMGEGGFAPLLTRAVQAAADRSRELAG